MCLVSGVIGHLQAQQGLSLSLPNPLASVLFPFLPRDSDTTSENGDSSPDSLLFHLVWQSVCVCRGEKDRGSVCEMTPTLNRVPCCAYSRMGPTVLSDDILSLWYSRMGPAVLSDDLLSLWLHESRQSPKLNCKRFLGVQPRMSVLTQKLTGNGPGPATLQPLRVAQL